MSIKSTADEFFDACETGKGWEVCKQWCHPDATFSAQSDALADVKSLAGYCDWMQGMLGPLPDGRYELKSTAIDEDKSVAIYYAVFHGTNPGEAPVSPTGKSTSTDYVYSIDFVDGKIKQMTKIWNDGYALRELGWA